jgi:hypothetical protein
MKQIAIAFAALTLIGAAPAQNPSLADTLAWMDSTYNSHNATGGGFGHGLRENANNGKPFLRRTESFTYKGCELTLTLRDDPNVSKSMVMDSTDTFNLADIDPASIKIYRYVSYHGGLGCEANPTECDMEMIEFETRNQLPKMRSTTHAVFPNLKGRDHESRGESKSFVSTFYLDDIAYANRFEAAFRHAIELCGGKPSTF